MTDQFDWRRHPDLLREDEQDPPSENRFREVSDNVGKEVKAIFEGKPPAEVMERIKELLIEYRKEINADDNLKFQDWKQSKMIHGNKKIPPKIIRLTHLYSLTTDHLFSIDESDVAFILFVISFDSLVEPGKENQLNTCTVNYYTWPDYVEVVNHRVEGDVIELELEVVGDVQTMEFDELVDWSQALKLQYDEIIVNKMQ